MTGMADQVGHDEERAGMTEMADQVGHDGNSRRGDD